MKSDRLKRLLSRFFFLALVLVLPVLSSAAPVTMQLDQVRVSDLARIVYGDALRLPYILDGELLNSPDSVSVHWNSVRKDDLDSLMRELLRHRGFETDNMQGVLMIRKRSTHDDGLLLYRPRYRSVQYLSDIVSRVADADPLGTRGMSAPVEFKAAISKGVSVPGSAASQFDKGALDQLAYNCIPAKCEQLRKLLEDLDTQEAQVVLRAAIYEVGAAQGEGSAVQVAAKLLQGRLSFSAGAAAAGSASIQIASAGLDAVLSVLDQDSRFKVLSRPMLRVRTGAQARFSVGQQVPVLGAISQDRNGNTVQSVEYRQSGTIFTVQPDIRDAVIDLNITQELSSFVATTTGVNNSPTLLQRMASSQLSIKPGEVVVFAGLEEHKDDQAGSRFLGFSLGSQKNSNSSEVLLFIEAERI